MQQDRPPLHYRKKERTAANTNNMISKMCIRDRLGEIPRGQIVSMNFWGFPASMLREMEAGFPAVLDKILAENPLKGEYFLPGVVDRLLHEGKADVKVLPVSYTHLASVSHTPRETNPFSVSVFSIS